MINVSIDREHCISCGQCWESCPNFFEANPDDGWSQVAAKFRIAGKMNEGVAFEDLEACVKQASKDCPAQVINVSPPAMGFEPI
jgi:ferredoxin